MGTVRRPALAKGTIWGHLHIVGMFDDRRPPITVDARWGSLSSRGSRSAPFSAVLPTSDPLAIKSVRIEYRAERARARTDRKRVVKGKGVSVRVDIGGRRII